MEIIHNGTKCTVIKETYQDNGRTALSLVEASTGEPWATATVNFPHFFPRTENHVLIKDYSENAGILKALIDGGIVKLAGNTFRAGHATVTEVEIIK